MICLFVILTKTIKIIFSVKSITFSIRCYLLISNTKAIINDYININLIGLLINKLRASNTILCEDWDIFYFVVKAPSLAIEI